MSVPAGTVVRGPRLASHQPGGHHSSCCFSIEPLCPQSSLLFPYLCSCRSCQLGCHPFPFHCSPRPLVTPPPRHIGRAQETHSLALLEEVSLPSPWDTQAALYPPVPVTVFPRPWDKDTQAFLSPLGEGRHHWAPRNPGTFRTPGMCRGLARKTAGARLSL